MHPREQSQTPDQERRVRRIAFIVVILLAVLTFGATFARMYADYLWHRHDSGAVVVFSTALKMRLTLLVIGWVIATVVIYLSGKIALSAVLIFARSPETMAEEVLYRIVSFLQRTGLVILRVGSPIVGFFFGVGLGSNWEESLRFLNAVQFGRSDPIFSADYGYYVFQLPFYNAILGWAFGLWAFSAAIVLLVYFGIRSAATITRVSLTSPTTRIQISIMAAVGLLLLAAFVWLKRYDLVNAPHTRFTGAGYATLKEISALGIVSMILLATAALTIVNIRLWRAYAAPVAGGAVALLVYIIGAGVYPGIVQNYEVKPNELERERPYITRAIEATRWGYNLDKVGLRPVEVQLRPTEQEIREAEGTIGNMRLWDPDILRSNMQVQQSLRNYYVFQDIDVGRYEIAGRRRLIMLGVRDLLTEGLPAGSSTWQNERMQYTHGNGIAAVKVNSSTVEGNPHYLLKDVPPKGVPELELTQPRIYFSDMVGADGAPVDRYVIVRSELPEFDYSMAEEETEHRWTGTRGIPISGFFTKLLFSIHLGDQNILFTHAITPETRLLWRRSVRVRARSIFPWLLWDADPYIAIVKGRAVWILDGYSKTNAIPYSEPTVVRGQPVNYIRNSVKMTIDAYTGDWKAYAMEPDDPILRCYDKIYPGLLTDVSEAPEEIRRQFRYPEDMFMVQSLQLGRYHITDPTRFYRDEDAWAVAKQTSAEGAGAQMKPYYVQMRLPDEKRDVFLLILPFTPAGRSNMIGWMAAHCDPEDYGRLTLYKFQTDRNINGPEQQEAKFENDVELSKVMTLLSQRGSRVRHGNLLVVPIGSSVMYLKTLFLEADRPGIQTIPELKLIVLAYGDKIVFAESYARALQMLTGDDRQQPQPTAPTDPAQPTEAVPSVVMSEGAREALALIQRGEDALKNGDWAAYGKAQDELKSLMNRLAQGGGAN